MTDKQSRDKEFILNIIDDFVEEIISNAQKDEIDNEGDDNIPDTELLEIQKNVVILAKKNRLLEIQEEIKKDKENNSENVIPISSAHQQKAYRQALSTNNLTKAARNEGDMSLQDDEQAFLALKELGLIDDENEEK